jgi:ABC-type lipoprotein export system ATPase subunit
MFYGCLIGRFWNRAIDAFAAANPLLLRWLGTPVESRARNLPRITYFGLLDPDEDYPVFQHSRPEDQMAPDFVEIRNLAFSYPEQFEGIPPWKLVIKHLAIPSSTICRVIGGNMVGKTTLLRVLAGMESVSYSTETQITGSLIQSNGNRGKSIYTLRPRNTFFLSHSDRMFPELTIWENVRLARNCGMLSKKDAYQRFRQYLSGLQILRDKSERTCLGSLSSGGQALIRLARAYAWGAQLVLIDEVTAHLDDDSATAFFGNLGLLLKDGCSVVLVSHDRRDHDLAENVANEGNRSIAIAIERKENTSCVIEPSSS